MIFIKRLSIFILILLITFSAVFPTNAMASPSEKLFYDDFSYYPNAELQGWVTEEMGGSVKRENDRVKLSTNAANTQARIYPFLSADLYQERLTLEFNVEFSGANVSRQFSLRDSQDNWYHIFNRDSNGRMGLGHTSGDKNSVTLENGEEFSIRLEIYNNPDETYTQIYVNEAMAGIVTPSGEWNNNIRKIYFLINSGSISSASDMYIDDVSLCVSPEPYYIEADTAFSLNSLEFIDASGNEACYLKEGKISVKAMAECCKGMSVNMVAAYYTKNENGYVLKDVSISKDTKLTENEALVQCDVDVTDSKNALIKVFVLDGGLSAIEPAMPAAYLLPQPDSAEVTHPYNESRYSYISLMGYDERAEVLKATQESLQEELNQYINMDEKHLTEAVRSLLFGKLYIDGQSTEVEKIASGFATLYNKTGNEKFAKYSAITIKAMAENYKTCSRVYKDRFFGYMNIIPSRAVYAYDMIYNSESLADMGEEVREEIEEYFFSCAMDMYEIYNHRQFTNITIYGIRDAFFVGVTLNSPELISLYEQWAQKLAGSDHFYADGMWEEGTVSYHSQVYGELKLCLDNINSCYGKKLGYNYSINSVGKSVEGKFVYPDGSVVAINDTHFSKEPSASIDEKNIKDVQMPNFKHYSISSGNSDDATSVHINFEAQSLANSHNHLDYLGMTLWSAGAELLPDAGYAVGSGTKEHYFFTSPLAHNTVWVWDKDTKNYKQNMNKYSASALFAYDDGKVSGDKVQLIDASQEGQGADMAEIKRRTLLTVSLGNNRFYTLDVNRLKGGDAHELYLRGSEEEDVVLSGDLALTQYTGTLSDYLKSIEREEGFTGVSNYNFNLRDLCDNPQYASIDTPYSFTWTGAVSGTKLNVFQNDVEGSEVIFTQIPSLRRAQGDTSKFDDYHTMQLYRRKTQVGSSITKYASVYEGVRKSQEALVKNVEWEYPADETDMTIAVKVTTDSFTDIIYLSDDFDKREAFGIGFAGKYAIIRLDKSGNVVFGYIYSQGEISRDDFILTGIDEQTLTVTGTSRNGKNTISLTGEINASAGSYIICSLDENFGYGYEILNTAGKEAEVNSPPAFDVVGNKTRLAFHDGLYLKPNAKGSCYFYNMFGRKEFPLAKAIIKTPVYIEK